MDLGNERAKLHDRMKDLTVLWVELIREWNDPVRREFEETHWAELQARVQAALRAMDRMDHVIRQTRQDCS
jgi:hypothetical protein